MNVGEGAALLREGVGKAFDGALGELVHKLGEGVDRQGGGDEGREEEETHGG